MPPQVRGVHRAGHHAASDDQTASVRRRFVIRKASFRR
jgi:hypothetical protein